MPRPIVELLYFESCPNHKAARELVQRVAAEETIDCEVRQVKVASVDEAEQLRFLGSPTVRVNGHDASEPGSRLPRRLHTRLPHLPHRVGTRRHPAEEWLRAALRCA